MRKFLVRFFLTSLCISVPGFLLSIYALVIPDGWQVMPVGPMEGALVNGAGILFALCGLHSTNQMRK